MMNNLFLFSFIVYFANACPRNQVVPNGKTRSIPAVDALIARLELERWKPDDEACLRATLEMLRGVQNNKLWATWVWDSMQPPVGTFFGVKVHIGNYDQCLQAPWSSENGFRSQYCLIKVKSEAFEETREFGPFDAADEYYRTPSKAYRYFNEQRIGVCLPAACSPSSVANVSRHMLQLTHLPGGHVTVDPRDCQRAGEAVEYPREFFVFWLVVGLLVLTAVVSTVCNHYKMQHSLDLITKSFCIKRNYNSLFAMNKDEIKSMNGLRFITAVVIVYIHEIFFTIINQVTNGIDIEKELYSSMGRAMNHLEIVVDTFFAMSGLLLIRGLMMGKQKNLIYSLVKRYIRLMGPLALCTLYLTSAAIHMGDGPLWKFNNLETDICKKYWWKNLLLINNDVRTLCHVITWYVSCDFQLAILATILFSLFRRNRKLGFAAFVMVFLGVTLNLGLTVYWNRLDIIPFTTKALFFLREHTKLNYTYVKSYTRAGSYLVGMAMGYIVATYKPGDHRNVISKKWSYTIIGIAIVTMSTALSVATIFQGRPYDPLEVAMVVATDRVFWAIAVCSIIGVCEYGSAPVISDFLSWSGFVPMSKISYCLYLLHTLIITQEKTSARSLGTFGYFTMNISAFGVLVNTCAVSLLLHLILEAPTTNVANTLFTNKPKSAQINGAKEANNSNGNSSNSHQNIDIKEKSL